MIDLLIKKIIETKNPSVIGLDTCASYLPNYEKLTDNKIACQEITSFNKNIIDKIYDIAPAVKVQVAYYEQYGVDGMKAFSDTIAYAKKMGMIVIADVKRNDISSTAEAYSSAYLGENDIKNICDFSSDFATVNGYLGSDGIKPFVKDCITYNKGIFALVKTSNKSSDELQNLKVEDGRFIYEVMGDFVREWGKSTIGEYGYSDVGAVVGATHPNEAEELRKRLPNTFFLVPGYGAQGGTAEDLMVSFDKNGLGAIVNSSRGILCAYKKEKYATFDYAIAARMATLEMRDDINEALLKFKNFSY